MLQRARVLADQHGQRLFANLQAHNGVRPDQVRALAFLAAAAGVDAALWYTQLDPEGRITPAVWAAVQAVTLELRRLTAGASRATLSRQGDALRATWPGGGAVELHLTRSVVLSVTVNRAAR